jgi:hypothetical protein
VIAWRCRNNYGVDEVERLGQLGHCNDVRECAPNGIGGARVRVNDNDGFNVRQAAQHANVFGSPIAAADNGDRDTPVSIGKN